MSLFVIATPLLIFGCIGRSTKAVATEEQHEIAVVPGELDPGPTDDVETMNIESRGFTFTISVGEGIMGHYDKEESYWVCDEDEPIYTTRSNSPFKSDYTVLGIIGRDEMGLVDRNGKIIVLPMYASIQVGFTNGFCEVQDRQGRLGLIAESGKVILPAIYSNIVLYEGSDGLIVVSKEGKSGCVSLTGEVVIPMEYESLVPGGDGMIWFAHEAQKWGCINHKNEVVVQPEFTYTADFINGKAQAQKSDGKAYNIYTSGKVELAN